MKKRYFLLPIFTLLLFLSCGINSTNKDEIVEEKLSKEEQLQQLYTTVIKPLFKTYKNTDIPNKFTIDTKDNSINGGATHRFLEVSQGLVNSEKKHLQVYVLAHEISHIVTLNQAKIFNLKGAIPSEKNTNDYKKSEYLADLIAIHLINTQLPEQFKPLYKDFNILKTILGNGDYMHPSGSKRVEMMENYINKTLNETPTVVFENIFKQIWNMS